MTMWIGYAKAGKELEAQEALSEMGITAHCAKVVEVKRVGKRRKPDVFVTPLLPNYLFIDCPAERYLDATRVKHLAGTMAAIPTCDVRGVMAFMKRADADFNKRMAKIDAGERLEQFKAGDLLEIIDGPLAALTATFRGIVEGDRGAFPSISADVEMMGQTVRTRFDVLDVRKAG